MHKERMAKLFAYEQLIINTEEAQEQEEMRNREELLAMQDLDEDGMKEQIMKMTNVSSSTSSYIL
jgi:hypothetical protein